jgi:hypothetical protein
MARELTGANVLLVIRDKIANDMPSLMREFGSAVGPVSYYLNNQLDRLKKAGLIVDLGAGVYQVADTWWEIQTALGISLTQVAMHGPRSMVVQPIFGRADKLSRPIDVFVLMPFSDELKLVWNDHIKKVVSALNLSAKRADDFFTSHSVIEDIWSAICEAKVIIADCTGRNPNVFYEIGIAHTIGKPVVLTTQNREDVPFDLRHLRYIEYKYTPPGMQKFEEALNLTLTETLQRMARS